MALQSYRELEVWQLAMSLTEECYLVSRKFPKDELFGLTSQIRRAATSVPANIAEGQGRQHTKEFIHFLGVARGSLMELETHLQIAARVGLIDEECLAALLAMCERTSQMLSRLRQALERKSHD